MKPYGKYNVVQLFTPIHGKALIRSIESLVTNYEVFSTGNSSSFEFLENFFDERSIMRRAAMKEDRKRVSGRVIDYQRPFIPDVVVMDRRIFPP